MAAAPTAQPAAVGQTPTETASAAPRDSQRTVVEEGRQEIVVVERPKPATFTENANVQPIYFDFDRYEIRPADAKMSPIDRQHLVGNIVGHMADGVERQVQERAVALWRRVDPDLGARIAEGLGLAARGAPVESDAL